MWSISEGRGDWEVVGVEWLLVKFLTDNFFVDFFQMEIFKNESLFITITKV